MCRSDDLAKSNNLIEGVVNKLKRQATEASGEGAVLKVENLPADVYLTRFKWDEAKFPVRRQLKETVDKITEIIARIEDDMKAGYICHRSNNSITCRRWTILLATAEVANKCMYAYACIVGQGQRVQHTQEPAERSIQEADWKFVCS